MNSLIVLAIPVFFIFMLLEMTIQWLGNKTSYERKDSFSNIGTGILNQIVAALSQTGVILTYEMLYQKTALLESVPLAKLLPDNVLIIALWILGFLLVDLQYYFFHRHSHQINILWVSHIVHHSSERYNFSVALRQSALAPIFSLPYYLPLAVLGIPTYVFVTCKALNLVYQFFIHTELVDKLGPLEKVLNTPSHHRVHHSRQTEYLDCNYAGVFITWDKLFGTYRPERSKIYYGIYPRYKKHNPIMANIDPLVELMSYFFKAKGREKIKVLLGSPLYLFEKFKSLQKASPVKNNNSKLISPKYSAIHFSLALVVSLLYLFYQEHNFSWVGLPVILALLWLYSPKDKRVTAQQ